MDEFISPGGLADTSRPGKEYEARWMLSDPRRPDPTGSHARPTRMRKFVLHLERPHLRKHASDIDNDMGQISLPTGSSHE